MSPSLSVFAIWQYFIKHHQLANLESLVDKNLQKPVVNVRSITIDSKQYVQSFGYGKSWYNTSNIRLGDNWLRESGFHPGGRIKVPALKGILVICPEQV
jgi:hypothetical protein